MVENSRRRFLKLAGGGAAASAASAGAPLTIEKALALPARNEAGSIMDVEHVVILMQENRSFDHYFGSLKGVRGFGDPRPIALPGGNPVWFQPQTVGSDVHVLPFRLDARTSSAESLQSLDHSWKGSHDKWKHHDAWIAAKTPLTMGYFVREDIPFYYALADAFTVCDAYHCSIFGPTNPNRMYLFSGTSGLAVGDDGHQAVMNIDDGNETADPQNDKGAFKGYAWTTYAERLQNAGVSWKVYQEYDNYTDNSLALFAAYRSGDAASPLNQKARSWAEGSNAQNAKASRGEHLVSAFGQDIAAGRLPQVSWIVAPEIVSEHPKGTPSYGEQLTANLIAALTAHPEVWAKTVFILNYDENDGFFDHQPLPLPTAGAALGKGNVDTAGEVYKTVPVGLGPRVPMLIVSPWTKGGFVNSELFDHTSVIRFLERRFGVADPNITPWRRAVCGDLTSAFDFKHPNTASPHLPLTAHYVAKADLTAALPAPRPPAAQSLPKQEPGRRPTRPLPYDLHASGVRAADGFHLALANRGAVGATFQVYAYGGSAGPWFYTVAAGTQLSDVIALPEGAYDVALYGPNGFFRRYKHSGVDASAPTTALARDVALDRLVLTLTNPGPQARTITVANGYAAGGLKPISLKPGQSLQVGWPLKSTDHWYDVTMTTPRDPGYLHQFAGHFETGEASVSDPLIGAGSGGLTGGFLKRFSL